MHCSTRVGPTSRFSTCRYRDGDYFGNAVNLAARVTSASEAGQFLITQELHDAVETTLPDVRVLPPRELKGVADLVRLYAVRGG
jgi:class 3 adenylate cyclase